MPPDLSSRILGSCDARRSKVTVCVQPAVCPEAAMTASANSPPSLPLSIADRTRSARSSRSSAATAMVT